ncbi:hypothetical protein P5V15_007870 [Pogonomyrmex californicus]
MLTIATAVDINDNLKNVSNETIEIRLFKEVTPMHYKIRLVPYFEEDNSLFKGSLSVNIKIHYDTSNISLHSNKLIINTTATTLLSNNNTTYKPNQHIYHNEIDILTLTFDHVLSSGLYILNMKFKGDLSANKTHGFIKRSYINTEGKKTWLAFTYLQIIGARQLFPCWDEPALKATFDISVKHKKKFTALSNMPIWNTDKAEDDMIWTHFDTTPIMSTYLVAIVVSDFAHISDGTTNIWCKSSLTSQVNYALNVIKMVEKFGIQYTNISRQVPKIDHVAIPNFPATAMENWGLIFYNETYLVYDHNTHPLSHKKQVAMIIAHEIVHHWFGNLVTSSSWSELWLYEGITEFISSYFLDKIFDESRIMDEFVVNKLHMSFTMCESFITNPNRVTNNNLSDYIPLHYFELYLQAPIIMRMLQHIITEEVYHKALVTYLTMYKFSSATSNDLWSIIQTILDQSNVPHENYKIKEVMDTWTNQNLLHDHDAYHMIMNDNKWRIPITYVTETNRDFSNTSTIMWLEPQDESISFKINPNDWIILNVQQAGYYRVTYDIINWKKIINYLNSDDFTQIHVLNRAQIINDVYYFTMKGLLNVTFLINVTHYLSQEIDHIPWNPVFKILEQHETFLLMPESLFFKLHMAEIFNGLLKSLTYEENSDDDDITKVLRLNAVKWACILDNLDCKKTATAKLHNHLADPDTYKISPWWEEWIYCFGLKKANQNTWNKVFELYQHNRKQIFLNYLACSEKPEIINNYLNIIASNTSLFDNALHYSVFKTILKWHVTNNLVFEYILTNLETIKPRSIPMLKIIEDIINNNRNISNIRNFFNMKQIYKVNFTILNLH